MPDEQECDHNKDKHSSGLERQLMKNRSVMLSGEINKESARKLNAQLLVLHHTSNEPITMYLDTPGGDADAGYSIFDMVRYVKPQVKMIANGLVASAGVIVYLATPKKNRTSLPNARFMMHQPSSGMSGVASDIKIHAEEIVKLKVRINEMIAAETGKSLDEVAKDTDRDLWLSPEEAKAYGIVSKIITNS